MTLELQQRLGKTLWAIADELRGSMNADDFRDYMLSLLFFRYLSDNYEAKAKELLKTDYPTASNGKHPLVLFYEKNASEDLELFEKKMREKVHYMITSIPLGKYCRVSTHSR